MLPVVNWLLNMKVNQAKAWQLAVGSWQLAVGSWQLLHKSQSQGMTLSGQYIELRYCKYLNYFLLFC